MRNDVKLFSRGATELFHMEKQLIAGDFLEELVVFGEIAYQAA
ncbi:MAG: hypothetical protein ACOYIK_04860 [Coriobacteriales bacterium]|jgi:hypothetical protein